MLYIAIVSLQHSLLIHGEIEAQRVSVTCTRSESVTKRQDLIPVYLSAKAVTESVMRLWFNLKVLPYSDLHQFSSRKYFVYFFNFKPFVHGLEIGHYSQFYAKEVNKQVFWERHILEGVVDICTSVRIIDDSYLRSNTHIEV